MVDKLKQTEERNQNKIDSIQILLIILSIVMLTYSIIYLLNYYSENDILSHFPTNLKSKNTKVLNPNEIGDSIGGILNPIIGITGSILTFLAFYIQYKANREQRDFFYIGLNREKQKRIDEDNVLINQEKKNHITNIKILKSLVHSMLNNYKSTADKIEVFLIKQESKPLAINLFKFSTNASYEYFKKLDFKNLYDSIVYSFQDKDEEWETDFIEALNILDFYEKLLVEMQITYRNNSQTKAETLNKVGEYLDKEIGNVLVDTELRDFDGVNDYLANVHNRNPDNTPIMPDDEFKGVDFEELQNKFLNKYLKNLQSAYNIRNAEKYKNQLDIFSLLNKKIGGEKFQSINYTIHLRDVYEKNFVDPNNFEKIENFMNRININ